VAVSDQVVVQLRAVGQAAFKGAMDQASRSVVGVGKASERAEKSTSQLTGSMGKAGGRMRSTVGTMAKWAGGAAAIYKGQQFVRSAATTTMDLAKSTMALERATGLDTEAASQWAEVLKVRNINTKTFQMGLGKLSKTMEAARGGNDKALATLVRYGVSLKDIGTGDVSSALGGLADNFSKLTNPAEKAALAQQLLGRAGMQLAPLLSKGSQGIADQLEMAQRYGAALSGDAAKSAGDLIARQRELQMASDGIKVQLGQALIPLMASLATTITQVVAVMQPLLRSSTAVKILLGALTVAFLAYRTAVVVSTLMTLAFNAALLLIPLAIVALIAVLIVAYKKVGWFRAAVSGAFSAIKTVAVGAFEWIKSHWPLLLGILGGPFGLAALVVIKNFRKIKDAASGAVKWIADRFRGLPAAFTGFGRAIVGALVRGIKAAPARLLDAIKSLLPGKLRGAGEKLGLWAHGGLVPTRQWGIVGERGPELLQLPGGARITPLAPAPAAPPSIAEHAARAQTTAHFYLDRRLIATAVAQDTADQQARR
jgi:hypothetical protein